VDPFYTEQLLPAVNRGLLMSVMLIVPSAIMGQLLGIAVGCCRVFGNRLVQKLMDFYTALFRGVPLMVQLFILYYGLPKLGIYLEPEQAAIVGFTLCSGAYNSEYIRGALLSIREGQLKAAAALGMSKIQTVLWIVVPQAFRRALPGCGNEVIYLIKYSSLAYIITCIELTGEARGIAAHTLRFTEAFMVVGAYYLFLVTIAGWLLKKFEQRLYIPGFGVIKG
jgi:polar amino acid transport system permease protein